MSDGDFNKINMSDVAQIVKDKDVIVTKKSEPTHPTVTNASQTNQSDPVNSSNIKATETASTKSKEFIAMQNLIERYIALQSNPTRSVKDGIKAIEIFQEIVVKAIGTTEKAVLDEVFRMFIKHKPKILSESIALQNIERLGSFVRAKVECFYGIFNRFTEKNAKINLTYVQETFGECYFTRYVSTKVNQFAQEAKSKE
jgi:hypothetical protein